jgi:hypothetical protein
MPTYTYNGVTVTASKRQPSSRDDKKYMRTVKKGDTERLVHYGDPNMEMQRDNPERRRNFLSRHNCSSKKDPFSPGFWACYDWAKTSEKEIMSTNTDNDTKDGDSVSVGIIDRVKELLGWPSHKEKASPPQRGMLIFKDEAGTYYWLARYSNNLKDREEEIISSESHRNFAALVKEGYIDPPELWFWHRPEWKWGTGVGAMYDDNGFAVAYGTVDKGCEDMAEAIMALPDNELLVSHGMPVWSVSYDEEEEGVIVEHVTREVSPLPHWAAANLYTGFYILEDKPMAFSKEDKQRLTEQTGISASLLEKLEQHNEAQAKEAADAGVISKEDDVAVAEETAAVAEEAIAEETPVVQEESVPEPEVAVVDAGESESQVAAPQDETMNALLVAMKSIQVLSEQVDTLTKEIAELRKADEQKMAQKAATTPLASMTEALARTVVGRDETRVDGRTSLGQMAPKETEVPASKGAYPFPWLNEMTSGGQRNV